jgi:predicted Zn-dependent peptidase
MLQCGEDTPATVKRITFLALLLAAGLPGWAQDFAELEKKITDFTLPNGLRVVIAERHDVPLITFVTHVGVGTANDPAGASGLARFFEHLAYKGSETLGSVDPAAEKKALDAVEEAYDRLDAERAKGRQAGDVKVLTLELELRKALGVAQKFTIPNEFVRVLGENGASNISPGIAADYSQFQVTLPSSRAELWFLLESQRLTRPVFRDFYRDRDDSVPDFRNRVELNPQNRILQALVGAAFTAHPYRNPLMAYPSDFAELRLNDARQFFTRYYVPGNMLLAIAGDIQPQEARRLAEKYFGPIPARPLPLPIRTKEPAQTGPRTVLLENASEAMVAIGFKRPDEYDRDDPVLDVVQMLLGDGRSSLLSQALIENRKIASATRAFSTYPGGRSPHLFAILVNASAGHTADENEKAVLQVIAEMQKSPPAEADLRRARAQARAAHIRRVSDNAALASMLALYAFDYGDWRKLFAVAGDYDKVTAAQVQTAALKYFVSAGRTTVLMVPPAPVPAVAAKGAAE